MYPGDKSSRAGEKVRERGLDIVKLRINKTGAELGPASGRQAEEIKSGTFHLKKSLGK